LKKLFIIGLLLIGLLTSAFLMSGTTEKDAVNGTSILSLSGVDLYPLIYNLPGTKSCVNYGEAYADADDVSPWSDKSGNGTDRTNTTAAQKPHWSTSGLGLGSVYFTTGLVLGCADADLHNIPVSGNAWTYIVITKPLSGGGGSTGRLFDKYTKWLACFTGVSTPLFAMNIVYATKAASYNCPVTSAYNRAVMVIVNHGSDITVKPRMFVYGYGTANGEVTVTDATGGTPAGTYDDSGGTWWTGNVIGRDRSYDGYIGFEQVRSGFQTTTSQIEALYKPLARIYGVTIP
jgi:hypothetical protein